jgi:alpha-1,3/alpha-1,6-mannosyltransferase
LLYISDRVSIVSINRFERKKNIELAIRCFAQLRDTYLQADDFARLRLVIAGGYNKNVQENVEYLEELDKLAQDTFGLHTYIAWDHTAPSPAEAQVIFLPSFDNAQRGYLLATSRCLLYTPSGEHFGIVPIEAMYARLPVVAVADGGPTETIIDHETGYLCPAEPAAFAQAVYRILIGSSDQHAGIDSAAALERKSHMGQRGRDWVLEKFTLEAFVRQLDDMLSKLAIQPKSTPPIPLWPLLCLSILITFILPIWFLI